MLLDEMQVKRFLPHRDPFLFIDSIESITVPDESKVPENPSAKDLIGGKVVAHFFVKDSMPILAGHFPGNPILPGVVQAEMMAQAACFLNYKSIPAGKSVDDMELEIALLGVDKSKFRKPVTPGMNLTIYAELKKVRGHFLNYECSIVESGKVVAEADILASFNFKK